MAVCGAADLWFFDTVESRAGPLSQDASDGPVRQVQDRQLELFDSQYIGGIDNDFLIVAG